MDKKANLKELIVENSDSKNVIMKSKLLKELILNKRKFKISNKDRLKRINKEELTDKNLLPF